MSALLKMHFYNLNKQKYPFVTRDIVVFAVKITVYGSKRFHTLRIGILIRNWNLNSIQISYHFRMASTVLAALARARIKFRNKFACSLFSLR